MRYRVLIGLWLICGGASAQNVGIGEPAPASKLAVAGNVVVGWDFPWWNPPLSNSLIVEGFMGVGTSSPAYALDIQVDRSGDGMLMKNANPDSAVQLVVVSTPSFPGKLCFAQGGKVRFCWLADQSFLILASTDTSGNPIDTIIAIRCSDGFIGIGTMPDTVRLTLPNAPDSSGMGIAKEWYVYSDGRFKNQIVDITPDEALAIFRHITPMRYTHCGENGVCRPRLGVLAQQVAPYLPGAVITTGKGMAVDYFELVPILFKVVQYNQARIELMEKELQALKQKAALQLTQKGKTAQ